MKSTTSAVYARLQRALADNRKANLTLPCVFMGMAGREIENGDVVLECEDDATFRDGQGELSWSALGVLADNTLGAVTRMSAGPKRRGVTVHLQIQMTGASTREHLGAQGRFVAWSEQARVTQVLSSATIESGGTLIAHVSGAFALFDLPEGRTEMPCGWLPEGFQPEPLEAITFDAGEREALQRCERAEAAATEAFPFIEHFWCGIPQANEGTAHLTIDVTPHLGNRVGHVHGGLLFGTAARVASAAAPGDMRLSNISAWFVSPGLGPRLEVRSSVVQRGRSLALVRTQIMGPSGKLVLETTSQHVAAG